MAKAKLTFQAHGLQFDLTLTFAGAATSGQVIGISGTVGTQTVTGLTNYTGSDNKTLPNSPYVTNDGLSFAVDAPADRNDYNLYNNGQPSFAVVREMTTPDGTGPQSVAVTSSNVMYVEGANSNPTANNDSLTVDEDSVATTVDVLGNDSSAPDTGETLSVTAVTQPVGGTVTLQNGVVQFAPASNFNGMTSFNYTISDGNGGSASARVNVTVNAVNDAPTIGGTVANQAISDNATIMPFSTVTIADPDVGASEAITITMNAANGVLSGPGLTETGTGTYALAAGSPATVQSTLRALMFTPTPNQVVPGSTVTTGFRISVSDGIAAAVSDSTTTVIATSVNDAPVIDLNGNAAGINNTAAYTEDSTRTTLASGLTVTDVDAGARITGATVSITAGRIANADQLTVGGATSGTSGTINYNFNASTGQLTLAGTATASQYQALLAQIGFETSSQDPGTSRTISWTVNDGSATSAIATTTIAVTAVNDAPVNTVPGPIAIGTGGSGAITGLSIADVDAGTATNLTTRLAVQSGTITVVTPNNGASVMNNGTASVLLTGSLAQINATLSAMNGVSYRGNPGSTDQLTVTTSDAGNTGSGNILTDTDTVTITIAAPPPSGGGGGTSSGPTPGADSLVGTAGDDTIAGLGDNDTLSGGDGNDLLFGNMGNDSIDAGSGNNTVYGGMGDDVVSAGAGNDLLFGNEGADTISAGDGNNTIVGGQDSTDGSDLITAGAGNDVIFGNGGDDSISAGGGNDIVVGGFGNDILFGNMGNDIILGNEGNDLIFGGFGDDTIYGGQGNDTITGNEGNDVLFGNEGADRLVFGTNSGNDIVNGFSQSEGDRLDLQGQSVTQTQDVNGNAVITLSGGGTITLSGVAANQVNSGFYA